MKNKYIAPQTWITEVDCFTHILAGSPKTGGGNSQVGPDGGEHTETKDVSTIENPGGFTQCSKGYNAWDSWDE